MYCYSTDYYMQFTQHAPISNMQLRLPLGEPREDTSSLSVMHVAVNHSALKLRVCKLRDCTLIRDVAGTARVRVLTRQGELPVATLPPSCGALPIDLGGASRSHSGCVPAQLFVWQLVVPHGIAATPQQSNAVV